MELTLILLPQRLCVSRLEPGAPIPPWIEGEFVSIARTMDELSIVCDDAATPDDVTADRGWRALKVAGPIAFEIVGVAAALVSPLAAAGISVLPIATYETDYLLVKEASLGRALAVLADAGHELVRTETRN